MITTDFFGVRDYSQYPIMFENGKDGVD